MLKFKLFLALVVFLSTFSGDRDEAIQDEPQGEQKSVYSACVEDPQVQCGSSAESDAWRHSAVGAGALLSSDTGIPASWP